MRKWNDLMGKNGDEAKKKILEDMPNANVLIIPEHLPATLDHIPNRVRIFVDHQNRVASPPHTG